MPDVTPYVSNHQTSSEPPQGSPLSNRPHDSFQSLDYWAVSYETCVAALGDFKGDVFICRTFNADTNRSNASGPANHVSGQGVLHDFEHCIAARVAEARDKLDEGTRRGQTTNGLV